MAVKMSSQGSKNRSIDDSIAYAAVLRVLLNQGDIFIVDNFFDGAHGAHFAAHGAAVLVLGCGFGTVTAGFFTVDGQFKHRVPIEICPGLAHTIIPLTGTGNILAISPA